MDLTSISVVKRLVTGARAALIQISDASLLAEVHVSIIALLNWKDR